MQLGVPMVLSVESEVSRDISGRPIDVISTGAALGAEIRGVDLKDLDELQFAALKRAWHDHQVILVRGQTLSDHDLIAFSRRFGDLDWAPVQETGRRFVEGLPEIYIVSNVTVNGQPIGSLGAGEAVWHTDMSYLDVPPMASMLYALEVPPARGNTSFCSMYAVYEALPDELKLRIADLKIKHDGTYNSGGYLRQGVTATDDPRTSPGAIPTPGGACFISAAGAMRISWGLNLRIPRRCSTNCGITSLARSSPGSTSGGSAISCCGITAVPCIGATRSTPRPGASCTERRSRVARRRSNALAQRLQHGPYDHLPDVPDPLCGSGQHLDGRAADQGRPQPKQYPARPGFFGIRLSVRAIPADRRLFRRQIRCTAHALRQRSHCMCGNGGNWRRRRTCEPVRRTARSWDWRRRDFSDRDARDGGMGAGAQLGFRPGHHAFVGADRKRANATSDRFIGRAGVMARRVRRPCAREPDLGRGLVVVLSRYTRSAAPDRRGTCDASRTQPGQCHHAGAVAQIISSHAAGDRGRFLLRLDAVAVPELDTILLLPELSAKPDAIGVLFRGRFPCRRDRRHPGRRGERPDPAPYGRPDGGTA